MSKMDVKRHSDICAEINDLYIKKNHDYGDSFQKTFKEFGITSSCIRMSDKLNRINALVKNEGVQLVGSESLRDTLIDLANYAILTIMEWDKWVEDKDVRRELHEPKKYKDE